MDWSPIILTLQLAIVTTMCLLLIGIPLAYTLYRWRGRAKAIVEALIAMPLILPPTVLGFYLLIALRPDSVIGGFLESVFGVQLLFSFAGLVIGSVIYSLPFMVHPIRTGLSGLPVQLRESAEILGKSRWEILRFVELPNIKSSILTGAILSFAHTIGEFGVILMIGGNIKNQTRVASIAIYDHVESLDYSSAHQYALVLVMIAFTILLFLFYFTRRSNL